jgi:hypothetical protein
MGVFSSNMTLKRIPVASAFFLFADRFRTRHRVKSEIRSKGAYL